MKKKIDTFAKLMSRWAKKYAGKCVAVINEKVVAAGKSRMEVFRKAEKIASPKEKIGVFYLPTKKDMLTAL